MSGYELDYVLLPKTFQGVPAWWHRAQASSEQWTGAAWLPEPACPEAASFPGALGPAGAALQEPLAALGAEALGSAGGGGGGAGDPGPSSSGSGPGLGALTADHPPCQPRQRPRTIPSFPEVNTQRQPPITPS